VRLSVFLKLFVSTVTVLPNDLNYVNRHASLQHIKQEIVHTLLLKEYGVSKKWVIIMDKRQDKTAASSPAETSESSAQDR